MFCSKCGHKLSDEAKFCPECGEKVSFAKSESIENEPADVLGQIEYSKDFKLKPGEKKILPKEEFTVTHGDEEDDDYDEDGWILALTNEALIYIKPDEKPAQRVERIPFSMISQVIYHKGVLLFGFYIDIVRIDGSVDRVHGSRRIALWNMALNDRFDPETSKRDNTYYSKVNLKIFK